MASKSVDGEDPITVGTYRPSEYAEAVWQVVSEEQPSNSFVPAEFKQVRQATYPVDTMFSDFGNVVGSTIELRREEGEFEIQQAQDPGYDLYSSGTEEGMLSKEGAAGKSDDRSAEISASRTTEVSATTRDSVGESTAALGAGEQAEGGAYASETEEPGTEAAEKSHFDEDKVREALQQAYEQGAADTRQEVLEIQQQLEERYRLLWEDMQIQLDETVRANETKAVELALQVAKRLVGDVVDTKRDYILRVVQEAIKLTAGAQISSVRVSPQDYEFLKLEGYGDKTKAIAGEYLSFVSDESIRAGCVLVTSAGEVDFDLGKAWERIRAKALQEPES
jgi:flagellar biosynthesis/type III secretory pathway protein FliH